MWQNEKLVMTVDKVLAFYTITLAALNPPLPCR